MTVFAISPECQFLPHKLWMPHPWRCSRLGWTGPWAAWSRIGALPIAGRLELGVFNTLPTPVILQFHEFPLLSSNNFSTSASSSLNPLISQLFFICRIRMVQSKKNFQVQPTNADKFRHIIFYKINTLIVALVYLPKISSYIFCLYLY